MSAIWLAILSIISLTQGVPFPGPGLVGDHSGGIAFVQSCNAVQTTNSTTITINIGSTGTCDGGGINPVAGHFVHIHMTMTAGPTSVTCSDTLGSTWTTGFNTATKEIHCYAIIVGGGADTVTLTTQSTEGAVVSLEFSGMSGTGDTASAYNTISASTSWTLPNAVTSNAVDMVIGCGGASGTGLTYTAGGSFTLSTDGQVKNTSPAFSAACEYLITSTTGTYTPTLTVNASASGLGYTKALF